MNTRRTVLAGLAGLAGLGTVTRLRASSFTPAAVRGDEVDFGFGTLARVLAPAGGGAPALFICGGQDDLHEAAGHGTADHGAAGPLAAQCAAAGFTAVTVAIPASRGPADDAWLTGAARWVRDNQSNGRLAPGQVFLGGEHQGAAAAFARAADFRRALGTNRLRAVVGINGRFAGGGSAARFNAEDIAALTRSEETSIVLISDGGGADDSLALGRELAALRAPFELHLLAKPESGMTADAPGMAQLQRSLLQPSTL